MALYSHTGLTCKNLSVTERFYTRYFGFKRARIVDLPEGKQIIFIKNENTYLELFAGVGSDPAGAPKADGHGFPGIRHLAFEVPNVDEFIKMMGAELRVNLGPLSFDSFIKGWRAVWILDPDDRVVEICQGYCDQDNPPPFAG
ncbi:MAG: VOC family protein [Opitutaceae bacterium]|jgi:glyoxylase I family protein